MREILFRQWSYANNYTFWGLGYEGASDFWDCAFDSDFKPEQYTGLKDKNGVKIFEGDILQNAELTSPYYTVIYSVDRARCDITALGTCQFTLSKSNGLMVVVGNIHEENKCNK